MSLVSQTSKAGTTEPPSDTDNSTSSQADVSRSSEHALNVLNVSRGESTRSIVLQNLQSSGLFSSFLSAAHNAAVGIGKQDISTDTLTRDSNDSKRKNLSVIPPGRQAGQLHLPSVLTITHSRDTHSPLTAQTDDSGLKRVSMLLASSVHFEPVHSSPVATMGTGDLFLHHFDKNSFERSNSREEKKISNDPHPVGLSRRPVFSPSRKASRWKSVASSSENKGLEISDDDKQSVLSVSLSFIAGDLDNGDNIHRASKKKNREFRHAFKNIPDQEKLVASFSCALSKEILVHGKMYLSQNLICFNSNILGWVTNLVIPLQEVIQIEKKSTALLFPNGMAVTTLHQKYAFATFHARDAAFDLITKVWKRALQGDNGTKLLKIKRLAAAKQTILRKLMPENSEWSDDEGIFSDPEELQLLTGSEVPSDEDENVMTRNFAKKKSRTIRNDDLSDRNSNRLDFEVDLDAEQSSNESEEEPGSDKEGEIQSKSKGLTNPGPDKHAPTSYKPRRSGNDIHIFEKTYDAPLGVVYDLLFGLDNSFYVNYLEILKNTEISKDTITGLKSEQKKRNYSYIKQLSGPIGPKLTKCIITESVKHCDFSSYCEILQVTQTPDVPLGQSFKVKTQMVLTWAEKNRTKMTVYTNVEWSAKSWIKGAIEKASILGQKESMGTLSTAIMDAIASRNGAASGPKKKRRLPTVSRAQAPAESETENEDKTPLTATDLLGKLLENIGLHISIEIPMVDNVALGAIAVLLVLLLYSFFVIWMVRDKSGLKLSKYSGFGVVEINGRPYNLVPTPETYLSDADTRKKIESEMWDWVMSRTGSEANISTAGSIYDLSGNDKAGFEEIVDLTRKRLDEVYFNSR